MTPFHVVIPARYGSVRLPGKPLLNIGDRPMIQHVVDRACASSADRVLVATDDARIAAAVHDPRGSAQLLAILTDSALRSGTDRVAAAMQCDERVWFRIWERLEQDAINHRVHHGCCGNPKCKHQQRDRRETRESAERAKRIADVSGQIGDEADSASIPVFFFDLLDSAQFDAGNAFSVAASDAAADRRSDALLEMEGQFFVELTIKRVRIEERAQPQPEI